MSLVLRIKDRIFYGWVIVAVALITIATFFGIRFSFGVFFKSLASEFELSRAATSSVFSASMVLAAIFGIITGWALDRYGPRLVVSLMGLFTGLSLLITSQTTSTWQLFLSYSLLLAIGTAGTVVALVPVVSRWFDKKRGVAIGIATSGTGLGTLVVAPVAAYLISNLGWRMSFIVLGLVAWLVVISLAMLLKRDPREIGDLPDGAKSSTDGAESIDREVDSQQLGFSIGQALRNRNFWLIFTSWLSLATCLSLIMTHVVPYATDLGFSTIQASTILSLIGGIQILARLSVGRISDIVGRKVPGITCALIATGALIWLIQSHNLWMFYLFAIVFGIAYGGIGVVNLALVSDLFGRRNLGTIMGALEVAFSTGSAIGAVLGGFIFDVTGSYTTAFIIGAATLLILALCIGSITRQETDTVSD